MLSRRLSSIRLLPLLVAGLCLCAASAGARAASPLLQNLATDDFETIDQHLRPGRWLVVMIWAHDCHVCEREVGAYEAYHRQSGDTRPVVLGITLDGAARRELADDFVGLHGLTFANLIGEPETVAGYYELVTGSRWVGTPSFLVFDPAGELRAKQVGAVEVELVEQFIAANSKP